MPDRSKQSVASATGGRADGSLRLITLGGLTLVDDEGRSVTSLGPRNLALLAYLALATKPLTRDHVAALFWGDRDEDRARHSMREALSRLRQLFGADAIARRSDRVMLDPSVNLSVDARALAAAASAGDSRTVVALYAGPFLDGVHTTGARGFEDWSDAERSMYEARFTTACAIECVRLRDTSPMECAELARRWIQAAPLDPKAAIELLRALAAPDTQDSLRLATREYHAIAERLANDFELAPHATVSAEADRIAHRTAVLAAERAKLQDTVSIWLRTDEVAAGITSVPGADSPDAPVEARATVTVPEQDPVHVGLGKRASRFRMSAALALAVVLAVAGGYAALRERGPGVLDESDTVAIVPFEIVGDASDRWLAAGAPRLIGAALSHENAVGIVDAPHVRTALGMRDTSTAPSTSAAIAAARAVGARWMLAGSVIAGGGRFWIDMRLFDSRRGDLVRRITVADSTIDAAVARGTAQIVASIDAPRDGARLADFESKSVTGYRAYIRAMQLHAQQRDDEAASVLDGAIAADSTFFAAVMERRYLLGTPTTPAMMSTARALDAAYMKSRSHATEFERLYFDAYLAFHSGDHVRAENESRELLAKYPADPRAYSRAFTILAIHGRFSEANLLAERAVALDSAGNTLTADQCRVCIGYRAMSEISRITGNLPRAEIMARRAVSLGPGDASAVSQLATVLSAEGRSTDALALSRQAAGLSPTDPEFALQPIQVLLEARRYSAADTALAVWSSVRDRRFALHAADLRLLLLRERGQYEAAAILATRMLERFAADSNWLLLVQGETLARIGHVSSAKRAFAADFSNWPHEHDAAAIWVYSGDRARSSTWPRALLADALWQAHAIEPPALAAMADTIEATGSESYFGRDWRLFHHVRGLMAMNARDWPSAEREFGASRWEHASWPRSLVERAHAQIAQGHWSDAINSLREAYTSPLSGMGRYVARSELDYEMARAFVAAGATDSARVYALRAASAWQSADPAVRSRLAQLPASVLQVANRSR
ncbi:MAG: hypothetical protein M3Z30_09035 [Gemmatimonadota bacterium]|nr:hypothetical protein [Gemmatimonadota bacterium]